MNGLDAVVFTAGIGENNPDIRRESMADMDFLGIRIDPVRNADRSATRISADDSRVQVFVIPTNEELVIASDTLRIACQK